MTESTGAPGAETPGVARRKAGGGFVRRVLYPLAVIAVIAGVIWYLERDDEGATSPSGERYGPVDVPAELRLPDVKVAPEEGAMAPDFLLEDLGGGEIRLSDLRGRPLIINFWATWCAPCRKEMPQFVQAYDRYRDEGLEIVAVNLQEGKSIASRFADDYGMEFTVGVDRDGEVGDQYHLLGLPTTYFVGRDGVIRSVFTGPFESEERGTKVQGAIGSSELQDRIEEIMATEESP
ncbi:MAG TPA: TlpA disulfide reductase family protein [Dehalococcoidia bacterium]|nr:TlpA disulfide reductase family protein [Dehalococcoidia bacterium]